MASFAGIRKGANSSSNQSATECPPGIDGNTTFSPSIPEEIKKSIPLFHALPTPAVQQSLENLIGYLLVTNTSTSSYCKLGSVAQRGVTEEQFLAFQGDLQQHLSDTNNSTFNIDKDTAVVLSSLYSIVLHCVVTRTKLSVLDADLKSMNMPPASATLICKAIKGCRKQLDDRFLSPSPSAGAATSSSSSSSQRSMMRLTYPKLERFRWRVDVTISNGSLAKVMRPSIMMHMILGDGRIHTFEVSLEQLNQLRYGVAKLLHDMRVLERHPIMRITDEFHKRENDEKNK